MPKVPSKRRARQSTSRHLENEEKHHNESEGQSLGNTRANLSTGILYRRHSRKASLGQKTSIGDYITCTETHLAPAEIAAVKTQALTIVKEENFKHITSGLDVNQPTLPHGLGSFFVTPPKILKQQLTGYCTSSASSPMGRDNKHGWYEEHEKFVAIAARSLSSVLLVGDSLVNGLARYHRVWSEYFEPLRALNFGVGGDRTQHVLWRIENCEISSNLPVAFVHCGTNNLDRDNPAEIRDGIASIVYTIQEKKPNANFIVSGLLPRDQEISFRHDKIKLVNQELRKWCRSGKVRNMYYLKPDKDWTELDGRLVERYYFTDFLYLVEEGYEKFANSIYEAIVEVSQGNVVGSGTEESANELNKAKEIENKEKDEKQQKNWLRTRNDPEANPDQQHYHPKHNRYRTDKKHQ